MSVIESCGRQLKCLDKCNNVTSILLQSGDFEQRELEVVREGPAFLLWFRTRYQNTAIGENPGLASLRLSYRATAKDLVEPDVHIPRCMKGVLIKMETAEEWRLNRLCNS